MTKNKRWAGEDLGMPSVVEAAVAGNVVQKEEWQQCLAEVTWMATKKKANNLRTKSPTIQTRSSSKMVSSAISMKSFVTRSTIACFTVATCK